MARLKPTTRRAVEEIAEQLRKVADDIEPARPFLAELYRSLSEELDSSFVVSEAPFRLRYPEGAWAEIEKLDGHQAEPDAVVIYPKDFNPSKYHTRLMKCMSSG